jgi:four helix bundle protein
MTKGWRFEDLIGWQKARLLANYLFGLTGHLEFSKDYRLRGQILDAAGSVMHNIAEGADSGSDPEFIRFLKIARRSASEVQSELYLALDRKYIEQSELKQAYDQADEIKRLINGLIAYLRKAKKSDHHQVSDLLVAYRLEDIDELSLTADHPTDDYLPAIYQTNDYQTNDY